MSRQQVVPPRSRSHQDSGWAWAVLTGSCIGSFMYGLAYSGGVFNIILLEVFGMSKQATAWVIALQSCLWSLGGPLSSLLTDKLGERWTIVFGGLVGFTGYFLTFFAESFIHVFITFGFIAGLGYGISFVPCFSVISLYFERRRNMAFGITSTSTALGTMVLPGLIALCADYFGWRGCMLIISAVLLHNLISGALFRPLQGSHCQNFEDLTLSLDIEEVENRKSVLDTNRQKDQLLNELLDTNQPQQQLKELVNPTDSSKNTKHIVLHFESPPEKGNKSICEDMDFMEIKSLMNKPVIPSSSSKHKSNLCCANWEFMSNGAFLLYCASLFGINISVFITYIHYPAFFMQNGATLTDISFGFILLGVCNILARIVGGIATNSKDFDVILVNMASCGFAGITNLFCPLLSTTYVGQMTFSALYGFYGNWIWSMMAPVTIEIVSVENLTRALGIINFFGGIGGLLGPPFAGWLVDFSETYIYSFYLSGCVSLLCAVFMMIATILVRRQKLADKIIPSRNPQPNLVQ